MPTPADLAGRPQRPLTARPVTAGRPTKPKSRMRATSAPATAPDAPFRARWETGIRYSGLHPNARLVGLTLASMADWHTGVIPAEDMPGVPRLSMATGLWEQSVRNSLASLIHGGWIVRHESPTYPRPIHLLIPGRAPR